MKQIRVSALSAFLLLFHSMVSAQPVTIYTEEFPPFNFTENGRAAGVSTEIVEAVMGRAKIDYVIKSYPWARTYVEARGRPNAFIYSISRRAKREKLFKWIGVIVPSRHSVFGLRRRGITIQGLGDLQYYRIGTTIEDARETYLVAKGFDISRLDRLGGDDSYALNYKKLKLGRIDLWPIPDAVAYHVARQAGDDPDRVLCKVFELTEISHGGYYLAAGLSTPDAVVKRLKMHLSAFKDSPDYAAILKKWGVTFDCSRMAPKHSSHIVPGQKTEASGHPL